MFGQVACPPESLGLFLNLTKAMLQKVQGLYLAVHTVKSPSLLLRRLRHSLMNKLESSEYNTMLGVLHVEGGMTENPSGEAGGEQTRKFHDK